MCIQMRWGVNAERIHTPVGIFSPVAQADTAPVTIVSLAGVQWIAAEDAHVNPWESNLPNSLWLHLVQSHLYLMLLPPLLWLGAALFCSFPYDARARSITYLEV